MSFYAKLFVDGQECNVLYCTYRFIQHTDAIGQPNSITRGGSIILSIESTSNTEIAHWVISPTMKKSGYITLYRRDTMSTLKKIVFTDAYCVDYQETFNHTGGHPLQIDVELSAKELMINDAEFKNNWVED